MTLTPLTPDLPRAFAIRLDEGAQRFSALMVAQLLHYTVRLEVENRELRKLFIERQGENSMECEMCKIRETMENIVKTVEALPEINDYYDDMLSEVYNAAENAARLFRDMCVLENEQQIKTEL